MKFWQPTLLCLALAAAFPQAANAQSMDEMRKMMKELQDKVNNLERKLKDSEAKSAATPVQKAPPPDKQWGMTPDQVQELNRVVVKTEALEDNQESSGFKGLTISGQMDPTFIYNRDQNRAGFQFLDPASNPYTYDNSYFGMAMLDILKEMDGGTKWHLVLAPNRGAGAVMAGDNSIVHEASVSVPLTDQDTRLIAGQIPDWSGYEYLQPTLNKLITHNLLFDFTLPTAYTGAGLELTRGKWVMKGVIANMNSTKRNSDEKSPVFAYRVDYSKGEYSGFGFAGVFGKAANFRASDPETGDPNLNPVTSEEYDTKDTSLALFEADAYFIRGDWTLQGQLSYGQQSRAAISADPLTGEMQDARWYGASVLAAYKFTPRFEGIVRADYLYNKSNGGGLLGYSYNDGNNGIGYDPVIGDGENGASRFALSLGVGYLFNANTTFKVEYRLDHADQSVFYDVRDGNYRKVNQVFGTSAVVSF